MGNMPRISAMINVDRFAMERLRKKISQRDLAEIVGVTETAMSRYCNGARTPRYAILTKIAEVLDTTPEYLLGIEIYNQEDAFSKVRTAIKTYGKSWKYEQKKELVNELLNAMN